MKNKFSMAMWFILIFIALISIYIQANTFISADVSWLLRCSEQMLDGGKYYYDFVETNPPLIIWYGFIPIVLHELTGLSLLTVLFACLNVCVVISLYLSYQLLKPVVTSPLYRSAFVCALALLFLLTGIQIFGEREFLAAILTVPYALLKTQLCEQRAVKSVIRLIIAVLAGLGFLLKPYFLLPLILTECYYAYRLKRWYRVFNMESLTIFTMGVLYLIAIACFTPMFYQKMLPLDFALYLPFWSSPFWHMLLYNAGGVWLFILMLLLWVARYQHYPTLSIVFTVMGLGFYVGSYWIQRKAWFYHIYPAMVYFSIVLLFATIERWQAFQKINFSLGKNLTVSLQVTLLSLASICALFSPALRQSYATIWLANNPKSVFEMIKQVPKTYHYTKGNFFIVAENIGLSEVLMQTYPNLHSAINTPSLIIMPAVQVLSAPGQRPSEQQKIWMRRATHQFLHSILTRQPGLIVVFKKPDYLSFLLALPRFKQYFEQFHCVGSNKFFDVYKKTGS